ncbi:MAG: pyridoxal-dependent decarboxylase [Polyangiaceae bacterium]
MLAAWSAANFEREAADVTRRLSLHLDVATSGRGQVLRSFPPPDEVLRAVPPGFSTEPQSSLEDVIDLALEGSPWQHHPRYLGHQVASTLPRAALLSLVAAVLNNGMAAFEAGPTTTAMEKRVIEWLLGVVGWPGGGGVLTSGGSLGNLTALLAARQRRAGFDVGAEGLAGHTPLAILVSEQAHYSIERAAQTMGLGRAGVFLVPTDAHYRMRTADLRPTFERARAAGRTPFALVASAGATGTGSIDPLDEVADVAAELGLWLHVDGAHGASMLLSERLRAPLRGIERADSLVWDAHKLMSFPALATAVLFREDRASYGTFAQDAAYLFDGGEPRWFDIGLRTVECTKPLLSVPLYGALASLGTDTFRVVVERLYDLGQHLADLVERSPDFELACRPDCNIVCFRLRSSVGGPSPKDLRDALRQEGSFYTVMTTLRGVPYLRTSIMNPLTTASDLAALLDRLRELIASAGPVDEK